MNVDVRAPYHAELGRMSFSPGWARPAPSIWPSPQPKFKPAVWRFAAARAALDQAGDFVSVEQAQSDAVIFRTCDEPLLARLGLARTQP